MPTTSRWGASGLARDPAGSSLICVSRGGSFASSTTNSCWASFCPARLVDARIEILARDLVLTLARRAEEPQHRAARRVAAQRIGRRRCLRRRGRAGGFAGAGGGCAAAPVTPSATTHAPTTRLNPQHAYGLAANHVPRSLARRSGSRFPVPGSGVRTHGNQNREPEPGTWNRDRPPACRRSSDMPGGADGAVNHHRQRATGLFALAAARSGYGNRRASHRRPVVKE